MLKKYKILYRIIGISTLLFFIANRTIFFQQGTLENIGSQITYPFLVLASKITTPLKNYFAHKKNLKQLQNDLSQKTLEWEELLLENTKLKASLNHQELTTELTDFQQRYNINGIFVKILLKNFDNFEHYYIINKGSSNGVTKDMVMIYKFQLLGRISEIHNNHSKVKLITDSKSKIAVYTNETNARGIVLGDNNINQCKLAYVSHLSKVELNDLVLSSGQGLVFPEGFCLGKITHSEINGFVHNIEIEPMINLENLNFGMLIDRSQIINF